MSRFGRLTMVAVLGGVGVLGSATPAPAQQMIGGFLSPVPGLGTVRPLNPLRAPQLRSVTPVAIPGVPQLRQLPAVNPVGLPGLTPVGTVGTPIQFNYARVTQTQVGPVTYTRSYYGPAGYWMDNYMNRSSYTSNTLYAPVYSGYMTGGVGNAAVGANQNFARAQRQAGAELRAEPVAPRAAIAGQWEYEKQGAAGALVPRPAGDPDALAKALAAADEAEVASGVALNHILGAVVAADAGKTTRVESAYLAPNLLAEVRFAGPPAADALNHLRRAGRLDFPAAFDTPALAEVRPLLEREFAGAVAPVLAGKAADPARVTALEAAVLKARDALRPAVHDLEYDDAAAARRFLNEMDATVKVLRAPGTAGLVDPRWVTEGTNVADLARHMARNKLQFGPAEPGSEEVYLALHRGLAAYLYVLNESRKAPPKK